jgi:hypothetical protein
MRPLDRLKHHPRTRRLTRRLPVLSAYERRLDELHGLLRQQVQGQSEPPKPAPPPEFRSAQAFPPGHYYSPVVDLDEVDALAESVFGSDPLDLPGIELRLQDQWALLESLADEVEDFDFPDRPGGTTRYWCGNEMYGKGDATILYGMLKRLRPRRVIEIGSGFSSALVLDCKDRFLGGATAFTMFEPHTERLMSLLRPDDVERVDIRPLPAQRVDPDLVAELTDGDVLLIDSTHVVKTGSDVHHELFRLLPATRPGVYIHIHDIFGGFEYPREWVVAGRNWNEAYALRAFLQYNESFEVALWPNVLVTVDAQRAYSPVPSLAVNPGGAIWLRRR